MRKQYDSAAAAGMRSHGTASPPPPPPRQPSSAAGSLRPALSLTLLCPVFSKTGSCAKGQLCKMAHGMAEAEALQRQRATEVATPQLSPAAPASLSAATRSPPHILVAPRPPPPSPQQQRPASAGYEQRPALCRTRLCWAFARSGHCTMGDRCNYAHGYQQLRPLPDSLRQQNGVCPYWRAGHCKKDNCNMWHGELPRGSSGAQGGAQGGGMQQLALPPAGSGQEASDVYARQQEEITALLQGTFLQQQQHVGGGSYGGGSQQAQAAVAAPNPAALPEPPTSMYGAGMASPPQQVQLSGKAGKSVQQAGAGGAADAGSSSGGSGGQAQLVISDMMRDLMHRRFNSLLCPITLEPFEDPVVAADGRIYERRAIEDWLYREGNNTSPLTGMALQHKMLMPCDAMRHCVAEVVEFVDSMRRQLL